MKNLNINLSAFNLSLYSLVILSRVRIRERRSIGLFSMKRFHYSIIRQQTLFLVFTRIYLVYTLSHSRSVECDRFSAFQFYTCNVKL